MTSNTTYSNGQYLFSNDINNIIDSINNEGIISGFAVTQQTPTAMGVTIASGNCWVNGIYVTVTTSTNVAITAADSINPRKDIITINSSGTITVTAGTPSPAVPGSNIGPNTLKPVPPNIPANQILLAEVYVAAGVTTIVNSNIADKRILLGNSLVSNGGPYSYIIYKSGSNIYVKNGQTGNIDYSGTDAATVINSSIMALTSGGQIFVKNGTYSLTKSLIITNGIKIIGESEKNTIFQATSGFVIPVGQTKAGLIQLDDFGTTASANTDISIKNIFFDLTLNTNVNVFGIYQLYRPIQNLYIDNIFLDLGTQHNGIQLEHLGVSSSIGSYNLNFTNITAHNGNGTITLYLNASAVTSTYYDVYINNIKNFIDVNGVIDDRVAVVGNFASGDVNNIANVRNITIENIFVDITSTVSSGTVNGIKFDTGNYCYIKGIITQNIHFNGNNISGRPYVTQVGINGFIQDIVIRNIIAKNTGSVKQHLSRKETAPFILIDGVKIFGCSDTIAGVEIYDPNVASGDEIVIINNVSVQNAAVLGANIPVGIMLTGATSQGGSGLISINNVEVNGYKTGISNNIAENDTIVTTAWSNIYLNFVTLLNNSVKTALINTFFLRNSPQYIERANILSGTFAIDSTGVKTVTIAHGLTITPAVQDCYLTVTQNTAVDDWAFNLLKVVSTDATNVTAKINVSTASLTAGATAKLGLRVGNP